MQKTGKFIIACIVASTFTPCYGKTIPKNSVTKLKPYHYAPYIQAGGSHSFSKMHFNAAKLDLFFPIWQTPRKMLFGDFRAYFPFGLGYEGNLHLGYRYITPSEQTLLGIHGAYDRKKSETGAYFNQFMFGLESWIDNWFIGGNFYKPFGKTTLFKQVSEKSIREQPDLYTNLWIKSEDQHVKAMSGVDAEIGRSFTPRLTVYAGGYYFYGNNVKPILGPRVRATYDLSINNGGNILPIFDKISLGAGLQHDKPRGTSLLLSLSLRVGLLRQKPLNGVYRHMLDPIRRDTDIVNNVYSTNENLKRSPIFADGRWFKPEEIDLLIVNNPSDIISGINHKPKRKKGKNKKILIILSESGQSIDVPQDISKISPNRNILVPKKIGIPLNGKTVTLGNTKLKEGWKDIAPKLGKKVKFSEGTIESKPTPKKHTTYNESFIDALEKPKTYGESDSIKQPPKPKTYQEPFLTNHHLKKPITYGESDSIEQPPKPMTYQEPFLTNHHLKKPITYGEPNITTSKNL